MPRQEYRTVETTEGRPLLSIITITYNDGVGLRKTSESVFKQCASPAAFEHIIVDGACDEGAAQWYRENRPSEWSFSYVSEPDNGIYDAMNKGLRIAAGEYVCFLNSGDVFCDATAMEYVIAQLNREAPEWAYGRAKVVNDRGRVVRPAVGIAPYSLRRHLLGRAAICHQAVWMRRDLLFRLGGFDEDFGAAADYHLLVRASRIVPPRTWDRTLVAYLAGGLSDTDVYRQLFRRHKARVDAMGYGRTYQVADLLWTALQVPYVASRKAAKAVLSGQGL